jgi:hypothetical protein
MVKVYGTGVIYSPQHAGIVATFPDGRYSDGVFVNGFIETNDPHIVDLAQLNGLITEGKIDEAPKVEKPAKAPKVEKTE